GSANEGAPALRGSRRPRGRGMVAADREELQPRLVEDERKRRRRRDGEGTAGDDDHVVVSNKRRALVRIERRALRQGGPEALRRQSLGEDASLGPERDRLLRRKGEERRHESVAPHHGE